MSPSTTFDFSGAVVMVTGASRGIGLAIATAFARSGARVGLLARREERLLEVVGALGPDAMALVADGTDEAAAPRAVRELVERFGRLDVLVNNVGRSSYYGPLVNAPRGDVMATYEANVAGPLSFAAAAWDGWMREHGGTVVNVGSLGGRRPRPGNGAYNVSKAALHHLTRQLAVELAPGVRVVTVVPGLVETGFARVLLEARPDPGADFPLGRVGAPADIAHWVLTAAAPEASWATGVEIVVDGGAALC